MNPYAMPGIKTNEEIICETFNIDRSLLFKKVRYRHIIEARQFYFYWKRNYDYCTPAELARMTGFSHCTIIHACNTVNDLMKVDKIFRHKAEIAIEKLKDINKV